MINCPLCKRDVKAYNAHHFVPRSTGGKEKTDICIACHNSIHELFDLKELRDTFNTPESLLGNERFQKFVKWIAKKPPEYIPCHKSKK